MSSAPRAVLRARVRCAAHTVAAAVVADPECRGESPIGRVESPEQGREIAWCEDRLRQSRRPPSRARWASRFSMIRCRRARFQRLTLLRCSSRSAIRWLSPSADGRPREQPIQRRQCIAEPAERDRALGGAPHETIAAASLQPREVVGEQRRSLVHSIRVRGRERAADGPVKRFALEVRRLCNRPPVRACVKR